MTPSPLYLSGRPLTFGSLFTGCGGADLGLERAGMVGLWGCEVDKKCQDVLRFNRPQTPIYPDVRTFPVQAVPVPDVLWMSPPCQDLSLSGLRAGLSGERSGLFYEATRIAMGLRDRGLRWVLMEQVTGLFSSNEGRDVPEALHELRQLGGSLGWRVLDSRGFGLPQRRERIFFALDLRGRRAGDVLAFGEGSGRDHSAGACSRQDAPGRDHDSPKSLWTINSDNGAQRGYLGCIKTGISGVIRAGIVVMDGKARRITPLEAERAQSFGDDMTRYGMREDGSIYPIADASRYRMIGNAVTSNVSAWIARNLIQADQLTSVDDRSTEQIK